MPFSGRCCVDLRSGCTYWPQIDPSPPRGERLTGNRTCEVAIIGGGITGAFCAHFLAAESVRCILLDRRGLACGSTVASTGLLQYEIDVPLVRLSKLAGRDHAERAYRLCCE